MSRSFALYRDLIVIRIVRGIFLVNGQRRYVPIKAVFVDIRNILRIFDKQCDLARTEIVKRRSVRENVGVRRKRVPARAFDIRRLFRTQAQIANKRLFHRRKFLQCAVFLCGKHVFVDLYGAALVRITALSVRRHDRALGDVEFIDEFKRFPRLIYRTRVMPRIRLTFRYDIVRGGIHKREIPIAVTRQILQAIAADRPTVREPTFGEISVIRAVLVLVRLIIVRREFHCHILYFVPVHRNTVIENCDFAIVDRRISVTRCLRIREHGAEIALCGNIPFQIVELGIFRLIIIERHTSFVFEIAFIEFVHILCVYADHDNSRFFKQIFVVIHCRRLTVQGQTEQRIGRFGCIGIFVVTHTVYRRLIGLAVIDIGDRLKMRVHIGSDDTRLYPLFKSCVVNDENVGTIFRRRSIELHRVVVPAYRLRNEIDLNSVLRSVRFVELVRHSFIDFHFRRIPVRPKFHVARRTAAARRRRKRASCEHRAKR